MTFLALSMLTHFSRFQPFIPDGFASSVAGSALAGEWDAGDGAPCDGANGMGWLLVGQWAGG